MSLPHRDRSVTLAVFGILEILAGLAVLGFTALTAALSGSPEMAAAGVQPGGLVLAGAAYGLVGLAFCVLGGGLVACRRWARALSALVAWAVLLMGLLLVLVYATLMPHILRTTLAATGQAPPVPVALLVGITIAFVTVLFVVPGALGAWQLSTEDARWTCEWRDPKPRWTDGIPLPVLALGLMLAWSALLSLPAAFAYPVMAFGLLLEGAPAILFAAVLTVALGALAWGVLRRRLWAWWGTLAGVSLLTLNGALMFRGGLEPIYRAMKMPEEQVQLTMQLVPLSWIAWLGGLTWVALLAWLLVIRKHFRGAAA